MIKFIEWFILAVMVLNAGLYRGTFTGFLSAIAVVLWIIVFVLRYVVPDKDDNEYL